MRGVIAEPGILTIAVPPPGSGNGGRKWDTVRPLSVRILGDIPGVEAIVYEPTSSWQNVEKDRGVESLAPARATIAEMVRHYGVMGLDCSILEIQKLAWFLRCRGPSEPPGPRRGVDGHRQSVDHQSARHRRGHRPADHHPTEPILDRGQGQPALAGRDVGNFGHPRFVLGLRIELAFQEVFPRGPGDSSR